MLAPSGLTQLIIAGAVTAPAAAASGGDGGWGADTSGALEHAASHKGTHTASADARMKPVGKEVMSGACGKVGIGLPVYCVARDRAGPIINQGFWLGAARNHAALPNLQ